MYCAARVQGFLKAYDSVRAKVMAIADEVLGNEPHKWQAYVHRSLARRGVGNAVQL